MSASDAEPASRVVLAYPDGLSDWGRDQLTAPRFATYLRRVLEEVREGDEFEEFLDVGCCGNTLDVPLRVEAVEGGRVVGPDTDVEFVARPGEVAGGWAVQSAGTPD
jgi:hypothetical protein